MSIKRYDRLMVDTADPVCYEVEMAEDSSGEWVKYSDHIADIQRLLSTLRDVIDTVGHAPIESFGDTKYDQLRFPHIGEPQYQRWLRALQGEEAAP